MLKKPKHSLGALMAITLSAHLLSHPFEAKAEETEAETVASQTDTGTETDTVSETAEPAIPQPAMPAATEEVEQTIATVQETAAETASPQEESIPAENTVTTDQSTLQASPAAVQTVAEETANTELNNSTTTAAPAEEAAIVNASSSSEEQATAAQDVILAAYKYANPSDPYWTRITSMTGLQIPYVIINPSNGSGSAPIDNFSKQIAANTAAGIKSLGYINTQEFGRSQSDLLAEVDRYTNFYGSDNIAGIFFDEAQPGETADEVSYMNQLYNAVKSKYPHMTIMANPGRTVTNDIAPFADIWLTRETTADDYLNGYYEQLSDMEKDPASSKRTMHLVHSASPSQYDQIIALSRERNAGYLMVTDRSFLELPSDFENLVNRINSGGNGSAAPSTAPAVPEANQSQDQASPTTQQSQETPVATAEDNAELSRTAFFRAPAGERRRSSKQPQPQPQAEVETASANTVSQEEIRTLLTDSEENETAAGENMVANQVGEKAAEKTANQDRETTSSRNSADHRRGNRVANGEAGRSEREQGRNSRSAREQDGNRAFASDPRDDHEENRREKADAAESRQAEKDNSTRQDKDKNAVSSKQASAKRDTTPSATDNSGAALAILGGLALVGIGIYIGRALLKPKK